MGKISTRVNEIMYDQWLAALNGHTRIYALLEGLKNCYIKIYELEKELIIVGEEELKLKQQIAKDTKEFENG
jgi:hypothetical protein